jgi:uncharacterized membrane protein
MDDKSADEILALITATATTGFMWYIGIFDLLEVLFAGWVKYASIIISFITAYGMGLNINMFSRANKELAYENKDEKASKSANNDSAIQTIKNKFAEGEISEEEFNRRKQILEEDNENQVCPNCGEDIEEGLDYCTNCGEEL